MMGVTHDYFEQFLSSRSLTEADIEARHVPSAPCTVAGVADLACFLHGLPRTARIRLIPDFDYDGLMSGLVNFLGLHLLGFTDVQILSRDTSGPYNIQPSDIDRILPADVVLTSDVGTTCREAVAYAKKKGCMVCVTDHHPSDLRSSCLGEVDFFVNPMLDPGYNSPQICGALVSYLVFDRYLLDYGDEIPASVQADIRLLAHFAAMAEVSDSMPMEGYGAGLVREMLSFFSFMNPPVETSFSHMGVSSDGVLQNVFSNFHLFISRAQGPSRVKFDLDFLEFQVIPVVNSIRRMGADMSLFYRMLFGTAEEASMLIDELMEINAQRKILVDRVVSEFSADLASGTADMDNVFIMDSSIPSGICGLAAQRMTEETGTPCFVVQAAADGSYSGSARSLSGFFVKSCVNSSGLGRCEGHEEACGFSVLFYHDLLLCGEHVLQAYSDFLADQNLSGKEPVYDVRMDYDADFYGFLPRVRSFLSKAEKAGPFGPGFPTPQILLRIPVRHAMFSGMGLNGTAHTRISIARGFSCFLWGFDLSDACLIPKDGVLYLSGTLNRTRRNGIPFIEFSCTPVSDGDAFFTEDLYEPEDAGSFDDGDVFLDDAGDGDDLP